MPTRESLARLHEEIAEERRNHDAELWALVETIKELEDQLAEACMVRGPVRGGPPPEWDEWILNLPDDVFADCLGPKHGEERSVPTRSPSADRRWKAGARCHWRRSKWRSSCHRP